jgi:hypothetical protein
MGRFSVTIGVTLGFRNAHCDETLKLSITLGEALSPDHRARLVVDVISKLDLSTVNARHVPVGTNPSRPDRSLADAPAPTNDLPVHSLDPG